jgi:hypothetical protein
MRRKARHPEERKFVGFSISNDGCERRIAPKALDRFKARIRVITQRTRGISLSQLVEDLAPYLNGWRGYFGFCQTPRVLTNLEAWIRRRLRMYLWASVGERTQSLQRTAAPKCAKVPSSGCRRLADGVLAYVRESGGPTGPAEQLFRSTRSSSTLCLRPSLTQSNRGGTDPYARWCGRGGLKNIPLSRSIPNRFNLNPSRSSCIFSASSKYQRTETKRRFSPAVLFRWMPGVKPGHDDLN